MSAELHRLLDIRPGVTAIIGSGGKTSLMLRLCRELPGTVIVCTSTHIRVPEALPVYTAHLDRLPAAKCCVGSLPLRGGAEGGGVKYLQEVHGCISDRPSSVTSQSAFPTAPLEGGSHSKLSAPVDSFEHLASLADYVLVEADGSRGLPLKAHLPHEPVIPACADQVIQVVGLTGLNRPIAEAAHRPEVFARLSGCDKTGAATPERAAAVICAEHLCTRVFLNQADTAYEQQLGRELAALLDVPAHMGALNTK